VTARDGIAVIGAGSWGTALAVLLARNGEPATLFARDPDAVERMRSQRMNAAYLPDVTFPERLLVCGDLDEALAAARDVVLAVPSHAFAEALDRVVGKLPVGGALVWVTKGLEPGTGRFLDELVRERLGDGPPRALLSGPSFAGEVARGLPTAVTLAGSEEASTRRLAGRFHGGDFRVYTTDDLVGEVWDESEQNTIGASNVALDVNMEVVADPDTSDNTIRLKRLAAPLNCQQLMAQRSTLFDEP